MTLYLIAVSIASLALAQSSNPTNKPANKPSVPVAVWKQEPNGFRGVMLGSTSSDVGLELDCHSEDYRGIEYQGILGCNDRKDLGTPLSSWIINLVYNFRDDKVVEIVGIFEPSSYEQLRDILIAAYGKPHQSHHVVKQNKMGVTVTDEILRWHGKRVSVFIQKYEMFLEFGQFHIITNTENTERERLVREAKLKAIESIK